MNIRIRNIEKNHEERKETKRKRGSKNKAEKIMITKQKEKLLQRKNYII